MSTAPPMYDSQLDNYKLPFVQAGASKQDFAEVVNKVRELEINLLDLKSSMERR
jgi:hypothetical protein